MLEQTATVPPLPASIPYQPPGGESNVYRWCEPDMRIGSHQWDRGLIRGTGAQHQRESESQNSRHDAGRSSLQTHTCAARLRRNRQPDCTQWQRCGERPQKHQWEVVQHGNLDRFRCCDVCQQHDKREDKHWLRNVVINITENSQR